MQQQHHHQEDANTNSRRGSLAISALLNEVTMDPLKQTTSSGDDRASSMSPVVSSGATSPTATATTHQSHLSKAKRKRISPAQYNRLMEIFDQTDTPSSEIRENLANELDMTKREVQVWFQNRRAKMNRSRNQNNNNNNNAMSRQRQASLIPPSHSFYHEMKPRRASAYPVLENSNLHLYNGQPPSLSQQFSYPQVPPQPPQAQQYPINSNGLYPIAPMPAMSRQPLMEESHLLHSRSRQHHPYQRKPSAIDLLASAAEYVRADHKEANYSKT